MSQNPGGFLAKAWYQWKSLRLPWRKRIFVGADPQGNTYYILRQPRGDIPANAGAPARRLVYYPRSTQYSEVKVPPAWHSWLRYQRSTPPSMEEQLEEMQRQSRIKLLAAEADARWEAKPSLLDMPESSSSASPSARSSQPSQQRPPPSQQQPSIATAPETNNTQRTEDGGEEARIQGGTGDRGGDAREEKRKTTPDTDPWKQAAAQRGAPGEAWQPEAWTPPSTTARRR